MKITFEPKKEVPMKTYPCLRKSKTSEQVVMFLNESSGIEIRDASGQSQDYRGISSLWVTAKDSSTWESIHGTVTFEL